LTPTTDIITQPPNRLTINTMTFKDVQKHVPIDIKIDGIVQECVRLRKESKDSVVQLAEGLQVDRRKITAFEKGKFDIYLADRILLAYGKRLELNFTWY